MRDLTTTSQAIEISNNLQILGKFSRAAKTQILALTALMIVQALLNLTQTKT